MNTNLLDYPVLSVDEERVLFELMKDGDDEAREDLILSNQRLVASIAYEFTHRGIPLEELCQEGNVALIETIDKHDPVKGKLSTFAHLKIRRALINFSYSYFRPVKISNDLVTYSSRLSQCIEELTDELQRSPTDDEIVKTKLFKHLKKQSRMKTETLLLLRYHHAPHLSFCLLYTSPSPRD